MQAIYALDCGNVYDAYELYISARLYNQAHELAVLELAPDAVIRKDLEVLKDLFERIKNGRVPVDGWHVRGRVGFLLIFLTLFRSDWSDVGVFGLRKYHDAPTAVA